MQTATEAREVIANLRTSVWAFSALSTAAETGLLEHFAEPRTPAYIVQCTGVPVALVEGVLDVLVALGLVRREGDLFAAEPGLVPLLQSPQYLLAELRATDLQVRHLIDSAKRRSVTLKWEFTDPEVLNAQGLLSGRAIDTFGVRLIAELEGLTERMHSPSAAFLDIGCGIGAISIAVCRHFPGLRVVGLEPQDAPLAEARRNVATAGLDDRIELRRQGVEEMTDIEAFDLAFFPQSFMSDEIVRRGLRAVWRALRPGGWLWIARMSTAEAGLDPAVTRLRDTLYGGYCRLPEEIVAMVRETGFEAVRVVEAPLVVGLRPIQAIDAADGGVALPDQVRQ